MTRDELQKKSDEQEKRFTDEMTKFLNSDDHCMFDIFFDYRIVSMKVKSALLILKDAEPGNVYIDAYINWKAMEDGILDRVEKLTITSYLKKDDSKPDSPRFKEQA